MGITKIKLEGGLYFILIAPAHDEILWFNVPVDEVFLVEVGNGLEHLVKQN